MSTIQCLRHLFLTNCMDLSFASFGSATLRANMQVQPAGRDELPAIRTFHPLRPAPDERIQCLPIRFGAAFCRSEMAMNPHFRKE